MLAVLAPSSNPPGILERDVGLPERLGCCPVPVVLLPYPELTPLEVGLVLEESGSVPR